MKKILFCLLSVAFLVTACKPQANIPENKKLRLSDSNVELSSRGDDQTVTVENSEPQWWATCPDENKWITLLTEGNKLIIRATPNPQAKERNSVINVANGYIVQKIMLSQLPADVVLITSEDALNLGSQAGELTVSISMNADNIAVSYDREQNWLVATYNPNFKTLTVKYDANQGLDREAKIVLKSGTAIKEISVNQIGKDPYFIPFLVKNREVNSERDLMDFEQNRGSRLLSYINSASKILVYQPTSTQLGDITYTINKDSKFYNSAKTQFTANKDFTLEKYEQVLLDKGFVLDEDLTKDKRKVYTSEEYALTCIITPVEDVENMYNVAFNFTQQYDTFDKFLFDPEIFNGEGWNDEKVKSYEEGKGDTYSSNFSGADYYTTTTPGIEQIYYSCDPTSKIVKETGCQIAKDYNTYVIIPVGTEWEVNKKFLKLLKDNGFKASGEKTKWLATFTNEKAGTEIQIQNYSGAVMVVFRKTQAEA